MRTKTTSSDSALTTRHAIIRSQSSGVQWELWLNCQSNEAAMFAVEWRRDPTQAGSSCHKTATTHDQAESTDPDPIGHFREEICADMRRRLLLALLWTTLIFIIGVSAAAVAQLILALLSWLVS